MNIFNSLGSNYDGRFVWRSLFVPASKKASQQFTATLADHYGGQAVLTYKGRQALELLLKNSGLPAGSAVGINGFTCYVVYQAIERAGYKPVFIDVALQHLDYGLSELKAEQQREKNLKAVIVQNTLGLPVDIAELESFCHKNGIMMIEDLAHSFGASYADGREVGTVGEFVMLSFSQDKPLDVVAGGALVDRRKKATAIEQPKARASLWRRDVNSMYPFWTMLIRDLYPIKLGRYLHFGLKKLHLLATPMGDRVKTISSMESPIAKLAQEAWAKRDEALDHRQTIAKIYAEELPAKIQFLPAIDSKPSYLRFPIWVEDRAGLVAQLKTKGVYIGDTWYDATVAPKRYLELTNYKAGECPHAEDLAKHIVNLPTHRQVSEAVAQEIAEEVKAWLK